MADDVGHAHNLHDLATEPTSVPEQISHGLQEFCTAANAAQGAKIDNQLDVKASE